MIACMDTETTEWNNHNLHLELKFGYICYYTERKRYNVLFNTPKELFDSIEFMRSQIKHKFLIFTHNMDYDFKFILNYMREKYYFKIIDNGLIFSIKIYRKQINVPGKKQKNICICEFRNSLRLLPMPLYEIGISVKLHKIERKSVENNIDMFHRYCLRDCDIIYKGLRYLQKFFQSINYIIELEKIPMSFPSIAYKIFHQKNKEFEIIDEKSRHKNQLTNICSWINDYFRKFYYGGRTEVFDFGIFNEVAYLDVNSLYPSVMIQYRYPKPKYWRVVDYTYTDRTFAVLCDIDESLEYIPMFAEKVNEKLVFLSRKKESLITIEEYLYVCKNRPNTKIEIKERWECDDWIYPFKYMESLYAERQKMKEEAKKNDTIVNPFQLFIKLLLNSTYGKFAERSEKMNVEFYKLRDITREFCKKKINESKDVKFIDDTMIVYNSYEVSYIPTNLAIAHRITALSRLTLVKNMDEFEKKGVHVIYCDTDSIFVETKNLDKISKYLDDCKLGLMKKEETYTHFCALAPKEYIFFGKNKKTHEIEQQQKVKGIHDGSVFDYYENGVDYVKPTKYRECIVRKMDFQSAVNIHKEKKSFYDKRFINPDYTSKSISQLSDSIQDNNKNLILAQLSRYKQIIL